MAPRQQPKGIPPPYSRRPAIDEQVLAIAPDFSLAVDAIQLVQEEFPGTSAGDAWEFVQKLARLVRADVNRRSERMQANHGDTSGSTAGDDSPSAIPEDSPMPDAA